MCVPPMCPDRPCAGTRSGAMSSPSRPDPPLPQRLQPFGSGQEAPGHQPPAATPSAKPPRLSTQSAICSGGSQTPLAKLPGEAALTGPGPPPHLSSSQSCLYPWLKSHLLLAPQIQTLLSFLLQPRPYCFGCPGPLFLPQGTLNPAPPCCDQARETQTARWGGQNGQPTCPSLPAPTPLPQPHRGCTGLPTPRH